MSKIKMKVKCLPGDQCWALNYRKKPADWEIGKVYDTTARIFKDGTYSVKYRVYLNRESNNGIRVAPILLNVGDDKIKKIK